MARVYIDSSFFSAVVTTRSNPRAIVWRETSIAWLADQVSKHDIFISDEVIAELGDVRYPNREKALALLENISRLELH